ncbi:MAG: hypothetical protein JO290_04510 [Sphingomonadaceae bacterium]|nr:hypothetical protein [Sphingomonadaceae bacterium]
MPSAAVTLDVAGDPFERGLAQGRAFAADIADHYAALLASFGRSGIADPGAYVAAMLEDTDFVDAIERDVPHLLREVEGIAAGASLPRDAVFVLQLLDEEWAYRSRVHRARPVQKCSSFAVRGAGGKETWIGQNMDLGPYTDGFQRVVRHAPQGERPGCLVLTTAGVIALLGVNDHGVGVCVNSLPQLPSAREGLPVAFVIRALLEMNSAAAAAARCRSLQHATNQHYLIADADDIVSLECSSAGVVEYRGRHRDRVVHTNHPLANADPYPPGEINSVARLRSLEARLDGKEATLIGLMAALSADDDPANPVCRLGGEGVISFTTGSMIAALRPRPAAVEAVVSLGPPCQRGYRPYRLSR